MPRPWPHAWRFRVLASLLASALALSSWGAAGEALPVSKNVQLLAHFDGYTKYSACWSYVHHDGREYAVLGTETGTSIVNVTNPAASYEVAFIPGLASNWREMKQYRTWIYVTTEATGGGVQIIRMTNPESPVLAATYTGAFNRAHSVAVDTTRALLIVNGTRLDNFQTGMRLLSLANPESPVDVGAYTFDYVHDSWMRGERLHAFCISTGTVRVFDTTDPSFPDEQMAWAYPGSRSHSGETSKDGRYLFVCDEVNYSTLKVFDLLDLAAHPMIWERTVNPLAIVHNVHVKQDTAFVAWYTEGVRLFDVTDPTLPAEWGYYDTYPGFSGGFHGVWEVAPLFPSGTFIASDIETGLYVFRATPNYGIVKVRVRGPGGVPLSGADVVCEVSADSARTQASGGVRLALPPGPRTIRVSKFGYENQAISASVAVGSQDSFVVTLEPADVATLSGTARRAGDLAPLADASVTVEDTPLAASSAADGAWAIPNTPRGIYKVTGYRPGYAPQERWTPVEPGVARSLDWRFLPAAWYDSSDTDKGWSLTAADDNATFAGRWTRAVPNGTSGQNAPALPRGVNLAAQHDEPAEGMLSAGPIAPSTDATPGSGGYCFVTGNGPAGSDPGTYDVDAGKTTLTSPPLDLTAMAEPTLSWQRWFHMNTPGEPDSFVIQISPDGANWTTMLTIRESHAHWHRDVVRVEDFITPTAGVRVRFIAQDQSFEGTVEAGVDDFMAYDAALTPTGVAETPAPAAAPRAVLEAPYPNPASGPSSVTLRLAAETPARVAVFDVSGRRVVRLFEGRAPAGALTLRWDGRDDRGLPAGSGVYWIRAEAAGEVLNRRLVRVR